MDSPVKPTFFQRITDIGFKFCCLVFPALIVYIIIFDSDGCGDTPRDFKFFPIATAAAFGAALLWSIIDKQKKDYSKLHYALQILVRYFLAYTIMTYGLAKVIDMQFPASLTGLDSAVADMRPMSVAWTFFGYSYSYEIFIGVGQIVACLLLVFRRTATLGALLMATIMANIVYVNFAFDVCVKFFSCTYLAMSIYLLLDDAVRLANFFILNKPAEKRVYPTLFTGKTASRIYKVVGVLAVLFTFIYPTYRTIKSKNEYGVGKHTKVFGVWTVDSMRSTSDSLHNQLASDSVGWKKLIFDDYNYSYAKNWQTWAGTYTYTINDTQSLITMQQVYPDSSVLIKVHYKLDKDTLFLSGLYNADSIYTRLRLQRKYFLR